MYALHDPSDDPSDDALEDEIERFIRAVLWAALGVLTFFAILWLIAFLVGKHRGKSPAHADRGPLLGLNDLLLSLFQPDELRRILHLWLRNGEDLVQSLPSTTSPAEFVYAVVIAVHQRGLVGTLFDVIKVLRPERLADIRRVQNAMSA